MDHLSGTSRLRDEFNSLPIKSTRVFKRQLDDAGVIVKENVDRIVKSHRHAHFTAISLDRLAEFGIHMSVPDEDSGSSLGGFGRASNE
jgi:hypothetical protein